MLFAPFEVLEEFKDLKTKFMFYLLIRQILVDPLSFRKVDVPIALW
jgi:hypothetical protein